MKIVGLFNPFGLNIFEHAKDYHPMIVYPIYIDENNKLFIKYIDCGNFPYLLSIIEKTTSKSIIDQEIDAYLNESKSIIGTLDFIYPKFINSFYYKEFAEEITNDKSYSALSNISKDVSVIIEENYNTDLESCVYALMISDKEICIGSRQFIFDNNQELFSINNKNVEEIEHLILLFYEICYLEKGFSAIEEATRMGYNFNDYKEKFRKMKYIKERLENLGIKLLTFSC